MDNNILQSFKKLIKLDIDKPINFNDATEYLNVSKSFLYKLTHKRLIKFYKPSGKKIYFLKSDLLKWVQQNPVNSNESIEQKAIDYVALNGVAKWSLMCISSMRNKLI